VWAATFVGHLGQGASVLAVARAVRSAPPATSAARPTDLLLDGLALLLTAGPAAGAPTLKRALAAFGGEHVNQ
jgi:hypothetical protein